MAVVAKLDRLGTDGDLALAVGRAAVRQQQRHRAERHIRPRRIAPRNHAAHPVGVAHEAGDERVARLLVELARRAFLRDHRPVHHDDAVGDGHRLGLVVRDVDDGEAQTLLQVADLLAHLAAQPRVEVRQRLVEQQHLRLEHERARDGDALLLAAGELGRQPRVEAGEPDGRQRGARLLVRLRACAVPETTRP